MLITLAAAACMTSRRAFLQHTRCSWLAARGEAARDMSSRSDGTNCRALDSLPEFLHHGRHDHRRRSCASLDRRCQRNARWDRHEKSRPTPSTRSGRISQLFLVGDYMFDSTLNGVLDSAEYVAAWLAAQMAETNRTLRRERFCEFAA